MIRIATDKDIPKLVELLREYSKDIPVRCAQSSFSPAVVANVIKTAIGLGLCFLAEDEEIIGVIVGGVDRNIWSADTFEMTILAHYVKPIYRRGVTGGRLFMEYMRRSDELLEAKNKIRVSCLMAQPNGTNIKMEKHGFKLMQTTYFKE